MDVRKHISLSSYNQFDNKGSLNIYHNKRIRGPSYSFFLIAKPLVFHVFFFNPQLCFKAFKNYVDVTYFSFWSFFEQNDTEIPQKTCFACLK